MSSNTTNGEHYRSVNIELVDEPSNPIRTEMSLEQLEELADSIRHVGLIEPLVVIPKGERFEVIAGHRRLIACRMAGQKTVDVKIMSTPDKPIHTIKLHENITRADINPVDEGIFFREVMEREEWGIDKLAKEIRRSPQYIAVRVYLSDCPEHFQEALRQNRMSIGVAKALMEIPDETYRDHLFRYACDSGATIRQALAWVQDYNARRELQPYPPIPDLSSIIPIQQAKINMECFICKCDMNSDMMRAVWMCPDCLAIIGKHDIPVS